MLFGAMDGCRTLGQVSKQMDSLLDRQSSQRILPNESSLLAKGESRVQCHSRVTEPGSITEAVKAAEAHRVSTNIYSPHVKLHPYRMCVSILAYNTVVHLPHHSTPLQRTPHTQRHAKPFQVRAYPPRRSIF